MRLGINTFLIEKAFLPVTYIFRKYISCGNIPLLTVSYSILNKKSTRKLPMLTTIIYESIKNLYVFLKLSFYIFLIE